MTLPSVCRPHNVDTPTHWSPRLSLLPDGLSGFPQACVQQTLIVLNKGPKAQEKRRWQFRWAREKPLSTSSKWKGSSQLSNEREKLYAKVAKICGKKDSSIREIVDKEKRRNLCHFCCHTWNCQGTATVRDRCLVKVEETWNLWEADVNRKRVLTDNVLCQKASSLYQDFRNRSPEMSDSRSFLPVTTVPQIEE